MTHQFIVNTENVNEYGYRVLTDGIDTAQFMRNPVVLFMHQRYNSENRGSEVIGRVVKLYVENKKLIADVAFDEGDEFAKKIAGKVERNIIRMASLYADVIETSTAPEMVLPGQAYETVTKCKMVELSIVDIGGNDDALKLSRDGKPLQLQKLNIKKNDMSELKSIALAFGMDANSNEAAVLKQVSELKLAKETAENESTALKVKLAAITTSEATTLVDKAVSLGLIPEGLKASQLKSFEADFEGQKAILSKLITDKEAEAGQNQNHNALKEVILGGKKGGGTTPATGEGSFDYLQKHNVVELTRIRDNEPAQYAKLAKEYENGMRYTAK
jgi:hypothetical protein